jgi:hypothetical protein
MVVTWIVTQWFNPNIPVLLFYHNYAPRKFWFAFKTAADMKLNLHVIGQPSEVGIDLSRQIVYGYNANGTPIVVPIGGQRWTDYEDWACAREMYSQPKSGYEWTWDGCFVGQRKSDRDEFVGSVNINADIKQMKGVDLIYPLLDWTDQDVYEFTKENKIPVNTMRYTDIGNGFESENDWDTAYLPICTDCINKTEPVFCPKKKASVTPFTVQSVDIQQVLSYN